MKPMKSEKTAHIFASSSAVCLRKDVMRGQLLHVWFILSWVNVVFGASLLGVGTKKAGGGLEIPDASFQFSGQNNEGLTRLIGSGLNIELDKLAIKTSYGYLTLSPQSISFKRSSATWSTQYFDERLEFRRNNDVLMHIITTGKAESYQYRFQGEGHFRDILLDQAESSRTFGMLCRADKSIAAQKRLDAAICRQEASEAHLTITQQLEMVGRIVSTLTDLHFSEVERVRKDNNRENKQDVIEFMRKDIERQLAEAQNNLLRSIQEKNRTAFDVIHRDQQDSRMRLEAISSTISDRWKEINTQQVILQVNVSTLLSRLDSFTSKFTDLDTRIVKVSHLVNEQVLKQQSLLTEKVENSLQSMEKNVTVLQEHVHRSLDFKILNITNIYLPQLLNETTVQMTQFITQQIANLSSTHQSVMQHLNESWQDQHHRHHTLLANGLNTVLSSAKEYSSTVVNTSIASLQNYTHSFVQDKIDNAVNNMSFFLEGNVTMLDDRFNQNLIHLKNKTFIALQTTLQAVRDLDAKTQEQMQLAQLQFNASTVDQQILLTIEHWNTSLLHPFWTQKTQQLQEFQTLEASLWRQQLQNEIQNVLQMSKAYSQEEMSSLSQSLHEILSSNFTMFNHTLQSSLHHWMTTWQSTKQDIDASLIETISLVTDYVARNVSLITNVVHDTDRDLRKDMLSLHVYVSDQLQTFLEDGRTQRQLLQQNMSQLRDSWQRDSSALQANITQQLYTQEVHLQHLIQEDIAQRNLERANFTFTFTHQFHAHAQQLLHWQETWRNQTDIAIQQVHHSMSQIQHHVENTTSLWTEKWLQVHTQAALLEQRSKEDHASLQAQQSQVQAQLVQLALVTQSQQDVILPQLLQVTNQWRNWTETTWPLFRQETLLWKLESQQSMKQVQENVKLCQDQNNMREKDYQTLRDSFFTKKTNDEQKLKEQELRLKQQEEEIKKLRTELDSTKLLVAKLVKDQEAMKMQQDRMQESLLNQVLLMMKTQPR